ncbi:ATP-grasp domain-containing protein [Nocardiopsis halophila]|uniref:ATP-grasp domain-containing protein n=1 Tax=Nocardiopsis halophila TaxID=141692 RepID=UPI0003483D7B|nr:ATP-grasp domain-containing protein [Nocardiopsis halophila]
MRGQRTSILVTAAGAEGTPGKILNLRDGGYRVVAVDTDPNASGLYLADAAYTVPPGSDPAFVPELRRICTTEDVRAAVPLVDEELVPIWELDRNGVQILLPRAELVDLCLDKLALNRRLAEAGLPVPPARPADEGPAGLAYPIIVKPRTGRGSRGIHVVHDPEGLDRALQAAPRPPERTLLQRYVDGPEFSVSVVLWRDGEVQAVVPKQVVHKAGSSRFAVSRRNEGITKACHGIARVLGADGPFNVQLRLDASGTPQVFEINPRFSGSATLTAAAGLDELTGLVGQALGPAGGGRLRDEWSEGVAMIRHATETFVPEARFAEERRTATTGER